MFNWKKKKNSFAYGKINIFLKNTLQHKIYILKILPNIYVIVVKGYILNMKILLYQNHILKNSLMN
jgi:hypothetical protein